MKKQKLIYNWDIYELSLIVMLFLVLASFGILMTYETAPVGHSNLFFYALTMAAFFILEKIMKCTVETGDKSTEKKKVSLNLKIIPKIFSFWFLPAIMILVIFIIQVMHSKSSMNVFYFKAIEVFLIIIIWFLLISSLITNSIYDSYNPNKKKIFDRLNPNLVLIKKITPIAFTVLYTALWIILYL